MHIWNTYYYWYKKQGGLNVYDEDKYEEQFCLDYTDVSFVGIYWW